MQPILFIDFDGTLCHDKFWRSVEEPFRSHIQKFIFEDNKEVVREWMIGRRTSEEINRMIAEKLNINYEDLWNMFVRDASTMFIDPKVLQKIGELREKYKTVLVTDNMDSFSRFTSPHNHLNVYFDQIINSYDQKRLKRDDDGETYRKIIEESGSHISKCILIDDSSKTCEMFERLGGRAYLANKEKNLNCFLDILLDL